ncbi:hypothetical protein BpHYR1_002069 [Brachionus plicatilis]|uniref:Uncharacterized protein n=1 Tax=Brachionus plicatilis TaxID=10195 RepID=A0A3M7QZG8_BRAPC|nr:hypothetical protein BpHYR1_002069 [Brachionus plicatilis]
MDLKRIVQMLQLILKQPKKNSFQKSIAYIFLGTKNISESRKKSISLFSRIDEVKNSKVKIFNLKILNEFAILNKKIHRMKKFPKIN